MRANDIMTTSVTTVRRGTSLKEAAGLLASKGFTALPVVDADGFLVGIVTEADLIRDRVPRDPRALRHHVERPVTSPASTVGEVMTTPVTAVSGGTDVAVVAEILLAGGHRCVPVVDGTRLVGIVTRHDVVRVFVRDDRLIAADVRHRLEIYGGDRRWDVEVCDGVVSIGDRHDDETDRHVARVLAEAVPGVVRATAHGVPDGDLGAAHS